jgi:hypothetical protein
MLRCSIECRTVLVWFYLSHGAGNSSDVVWALFEYDDVQIIIVFCSIVPRSARLLFSVRVEPYINLSCECKPRATGDSLRWHRPLGLPLGRSVGRPLPARGQLINLAAVDSGFGHATGLTDEQVDAGLVDVKSSGQPRRIRSMRTPLYAAASSRRRLW